MEWCFSKPFQYNELKHGSTLLVNNYEAKLYKTFISKKQYCQINYTKNWTPWLYLRETPSTRRMAPIEIILQSVSTLEITRSRIFYKDISWWNLASFFFSWKGRGVSCTIILRIPKKKINIEKKNTKERGKKSKLKRTLQNIFFSSSTLRLGFFSPLLCIQHEWPLCTLTRLINKN